MKGNVFFYQGTKKLGNAVGYTVKGKQLFRAYQGTVANPRSDKQTMQRAKFAYLVERAQAIRPVIRKGFEYLASVRKCTAFNAFFHANFNKLVGATPEMVALQPENMIVAQGPLSNVFYSDTIDASSTPGVVTITVTDANLYDQSEADTLMYGVLFCEELNQGVMSAGQARMAGDINVNYPAAWLGLEVHAYVFTASADGKQASDSAYVGHTTIS